MITAVRRLIHDRALVGNLAARVGALVALGLATIAVARLGGPSSVGDYALFRVLPGLVGVVASCGLPSAVAYFVAGPARDERRVAATVVAIAVAAGVAGTAAWLAATPLLVHVFFRDIPPAMVAVVGLSVLTQLLVAAAKGSCQGRDLDGANLVILLEEATFLPAVAATWVLGLRGLWSIVAALLLADVATAAVGWGRLARRGFFRGSRHLDLGLARRICAYGLRSQVGGVLSLLNLRFDFALLGGLAGSAALGGYAVASKYAELLRLPSLAVTYVFYPRYAATGEESAAARARRLLPRAGTAVALAALPLAALAPPLLPALYGAGFGAAVLPAEILILGLAFEGLAGVVSAYLYGVGRPGLNSLALGAGVVVTVALDLALIPRFGSTGAAVTSTVAYVTTTATLLGCFAVLTRRPPRPATADRRLAGAGVEGP